MTEIPAKKMFHTLDQLKVELFPLDLVPPEETPIKEGDVDEAEVLANKLVEDLINPPKDASGGDE